MSTRKGVGDLEIYQKFENSIAFKQSIIYLQRKRVGRHKIGHFRGYDERMTF